MVLHLKPLSWLLKDLLQLFESAHVVFEGNLDTTDYSGRRNVEIANRCRLNPYPIPIPASVSSDLALRFAFEDI